MCDARRARRVRSRPPFAGALCVVWVAALLPLAAQSFRARIDVVQVTVTVVSTDGRLIKGLGKDDFQIFEDGIEQPITQFTDARVPVSLGLLLDASDSMRGQPVDDARTAFARFVGDLLRPEDEAFVATFNHRPSLAKPWTSPPTSLRDVLAALKPTGGTAIYDALAGTASLYHKRRHRRAPLVLVSDGADTASDRSLREALDAVRRSDAFVYAIAIDSPDALESTRVNPAVLQEITGLTGGYTEVVHAASDLGPATSRIADELNSQYTVGYAASRPPDGSWRAIRVRVKGQDYLTRARRGYYAVPQEP